jgi:hypothetical protein
MVYGCLLGFAGQVPALIAIFELACPTVAPERNARLIGPTVIPNSVTETPSPRR